MRHGRALALGLATAALLAAVWAPSRSAAETWCADPLWVHEWGVHTFGDGPSQRGGAGPRLPGYFHDRPSRPQAIGPAVRSLPPDTGIRELPVVHFYAPRNWEPVPLGLSVGFARGEATRWYPQVDERRSAADANGAAAAAARARLLTARGARQPMGANPALGPDPTRQLRWDALTLTRGPQQRRARTGVSWVGRARGFSDALWVNNAHQSERFVFYEGQTAEAPSVTVERGPTYGAGRRHYLLRNAGPDDVHDVFFVHREGGRRYVFFVPTLPAGRTSGFLLDDHAVAHEAYEAHTRGALRARLVDAQQPAPPARYAWSDCTMMRDPAIPTEAADGHRVYAHEVDLILDAWASRFFGSSGTTILYREDTATLDREMPLSVYTDMYHFVELRRLGLALIENVGL